MSDSHVKKKRRIAAAGRLGHSGVVTRGSDSHITQTLVRMADIRLFTAVPGNWPPHANRAVSLHGILKESDEYLRIRCANLAIRLVKISRPTLDNRFRYRCLCLTELFLPHRTYRGPRQGTVLLYTNNVQLGVYKRLLKQK
jgi:hypothetical protein